MSRCSATYRPHIIVTERFEERFRRDAFSVVHVAFVRVVSENTIDNNANLPISEPAFGTEPCLGSNSRRRHEKDGGDANRQGNETFNKEKPTSSQHLEWGMSRSQVSKYHRQPAMPWTPLM